MPDFFLSTMSVCMLRASFEVSDHSLSACLNRCRLTWRFFKTCVDMHWNSVAENGTICGSRKSLRSHGPSLYNRWFMIHVFVLLRIGWVVMFPDANFSQNQRNPLVCYPAWLLCIMNIGLMHNISSAGFSSSLAKFGRHTVDGRNPGPVDR